MDIESEIRQMSRSFYWQKLYHATQNCSGIYLFLNQNNFSGIQVLFMYWLQIYDLLYTEMQSKEWFNLDEKVLEDNIRCDAFLYWRKKEIEKKIMENKEISRREDRRSTKAKKNKNDRSIPLYQGKRS